MLKECIWKSHDELIYFLKRQWVEGAQIENDTVLPQLFFFFLQISDHFSNFEDLLLGKG